RETLQRGWAVVRQGPRQVRFLDVEVVGLESVAVVDGSVAVPVRLDVARRLARGELQPEAGDEPPVARSRGGELAEDGDAIVVMLHRVERDQASRAWVVEVPRVRFGEPEPEVDLRGILDLLLVGGDEVVLEVA